LGQFAALQKNDIAPHKLRAYSADWRVQSDLPQAGVDRMRPHFSPTTLLPSALLIVCTAVSGCASVNNLPEVSLTSEAAVYRLAAGDELRITVYGEERLSGTFKVDGQGRIAYPLLGEVSAEGLATSELEARLRSELADGLVNQPSVNVEVANYRPYFVLGEVARSGEFAFMDGLTIFSAVARAGGFTYRADQRRVFIRHRNGTEEELYRLTGDTPVQPGDTIRITERLF
jgi:protein involved in polysaccharide export with SLBB domain